MNKNTALVVSVSTNQFHFHHYDMTNLALYVDGVHHPPEPHTMVSCRPFGVKRAFETLFSSTGIYHDDRAYLITLQVFTKGHYILGFDLT